MIKESCVETISQIEHAIKNGANRIELCDNLSVGGTTPSYGMVKIAVEMCHQNNVEVAIMIRPRGGDFNYSYYEYEVMRQDIIQLKELNVDAFVFGCLDENGRLDEWKMKALKETSGNVPAVCHMAFDTINPYNQLKSLDWLINQQFERLLTHGGPSESSIFDNLNHLGKLLIHSKGNITIMPGGGLNRDNLSTLVEDIPFDEVHGTQIV
ncbi:MULTISPECIES: copper homeostasis protein CutC [Mammaliicoccus]|uniref:PF03932 family protein CutC n=1 Tax=Mammaliicoccus vitulinus TaxID=71237 RepID=A0A2T4PTH1_9STAP|nr:MULTISPECIES: copper homeostasis protein CutC [Mammaliicoccus]HAL09124.1 copper homeostasis protein CutC [Staphylococcus sp.]MBO3077370.1 copper homeostasis protein CutC [Mammaliicoccus vitulinus]MEB7657037.1 copper homeostasis protein CutC [Mammaliicoccus vitulinus]PTI29677.1 copper homeostasis protein CutC [Mammaliicoccus vitulinus]PTI36716.1 copper homeostasis protein CutC [Mammaliicoccus vitulinus]